MRFLDHLQRVWNNGQDSSQIMRILNQFLGIKTKMRIVWGVYANDKDSRPSIRILDQL